MSLFNYVRVTLIGSIAVAFAVMAAPFILITNEFRRELRVAAQIEDANGEVFFGQSTWELLRFQIPESFRIFDRIAHIRIDPMLSTSLSVSDPGPRNDYKDIDLNQLAPLPELSTLDLSHVRVTGLGCLPAFKALDWLRLDDCRFPEGVPARMGEMTSLRVLMIDNVDEADRLVEFFGGLPRLQHLSIEGTQLSSESIAAIASLPELRSVDLSDARFPPSAIEQFECAKKLEDLQLNGAPISDLQLDSIGRMTNLKYLSLGGTNVSNNGLKRLTRLEQLEQLSLFDTKIDDTGLENLLSFPQLKFLSLYHTRVTDAGLRWIRQLESLEMISTERTLLSSYGQESLRRALPNCREAPCHPRLRTDLADE